MWLNPKNKVIATMPTRPLDDVRLFVRPGYNDRYNPRSHRCVQRQKAYLNALALDRRTPVEVKFEEVMIINL